MKIYGRKIHKVSPTLVSPSNNGSQHQGIATNWVEFDSAPYGYYLGQFNTSDQAVALAVNEAQDYKYLAIRVHRKDMKPFWECGWALSSALVNGRTGTGSSKGHISSTTKTPCLPQMAKLADPKSFSHDPNCLPGDCVDGTYTTHLAPECNDELFRNDAALGAITAGKSLKYARSIKHPLYDLIGVVDHTKPIHYRFRPNDNKTVDVRSDIGGWSLMLGDCVTGHPTGGPPKL